MTNLDQRFDRLLNRRLPAEARSSVNFSERYASARTRLDGWTDETDRYLMLAMAPIEPHYTLRLQKQGSRIENQLMNRLMDSYPNMEFRRQGSVSNDTHIRHSSDVDVLAFPGRFFSLEMPQANPYPYAENPEDTLLTFRCKARDELMQAFTIARVDDSGSTAIKLSGGSLACAVDVVPSNWYNTIEYSRSSFEAARGVQVLNKETLERVLNFPFRFNDRLHAQDHVRSGATRRMIRFLKTLKADLIEEGFSIGLSSFDICSIIFRMEGTFRSSDGYGARPEAVVCFQWVTFLLNDATFRQGLWVVDDSRLIFDNAEKVQGLRFIQRELHDLLQAARVSSSVLRTGAAW